MAARPSYGNTRPLPASPRSPILVRNVTTLRPESGACRGRGRRDGRRVGRGVYDLHAIRLGDGYMSTWRRQAATPEPD